MTAAFEPATEPAVADALTMLHDAGATRVPPWMAVTGALAHVRPGSIGATIDWLVAHRDHLEAAYAGGTQGTLGPARMPPEMVYDPDLGGLDRPRDDHRLREKYLFADIDGKMSFTQAAVYAITGIELSPEHAALLDDFGTVNLLVDRRAWPMGATRRVGARTGAYMPAVLTGVAMMGSPVLAGEAAGDCARFLRRAMAAEAEGVPVDQQVAELLARHERVRGFGRPVVGPDERVPVIEAVLRRHGRHDQPQVNLLRRVEAAFMAQKGLGSTAAAWAAAVLGDLGMSPDAVVAVSNYWVSVCVYAQALYSVERGLVGEGR